MYDLLTWMDEYIAQSQELVTVVKIGISLNEMENKLQGYLIYGLAMRRLSRKTNSAFTVRNLRGSMESMVQRNG